MTPPERDGPRPFGVEARSARPSPSCLIVTHRQADLDGFASLLAAAVLHPHCWPVLPDGAGADLRRFLQERPDLAARLHGPEDVDPGVVRQLILVDCRQAERLGPLAALASDPDVDILSYDHHPVQPGDIERGRHVGGHTGANATLLVEALREQGLSLGEGEATALALGIFEDTGGLTYAGVHPRDFHALAWLLEQGADLGYVGRFMRQDLRPEQIALLDNLLQGIQLIEAGGHRILLTAVVVESYIEESALVVSRLFDMQAADAVFALLGQGQRIAVIARSRGEHGLPVHGIMQSLGGGGHPMAAAATLHQMTLAEAEEQVVNAIYQHLGVIPRARDFMTRTVQKVGAAESVVEGLQALSRYPHRGLPVIDAEGRPQGYADRRLLHNALRHGLGSRPLGDYAESLPVLPQDATLVQVRDALSHALVPMLAIVDPAGKLCGIITAADLRRLEASHLLPGTRLRGPRNLARRLRGLWGGALFQRLRELGSLAADAKMHAYLVGGSVRDLVLNQAAKDIDIVIEGDAIQLAADLAARLPDVAITTHAAFGTATLHYPDGGRIDLASSRVEHYTTPAALPVVEQGGIHADLWRRDFTINAMAADIHPESFGHLLDPYHGLGDLKERRIRVLHGLSFIEDPTRILRALRFEARLDFRMDGQTYRLAQNAVHAGIFEQLSGSRLWRELRLLLDMPQLSVALERVGQLHLWTVMRGAAVKDPGALLARMRRGLEILQWYHLLFRPQTARPWAVLLRVLLADLKAAAVRQRLAYFQIPARDMTACVRDLQCMRHLRRRLRQELPSWERYQTLTGLGLEGLLAFMGMVEDERTRALVSDHIQNQAALELPLDGHDLRALGLPQGPEIGRWLDRLRRAMIEGDVHDRETARQWVRDRLQCPATE